MTGVTTILSRGNQLRTSEKLQIFSTVLSTRQHGGCGKLSLQTGTIQKRFCFSSNTGLNGHTGVHTTTLLLWLQCLLSQRHWWEFFFLFCFFCSAVTVVRALLSWQPAYSTVIQQGIGYEEKTINCSDWVWPSLCMWCKNDIWFKLCTVTIKSQRFSTHKVTF